jgi:hypothetical protein
VDWLLVSLLQPDWEPSRNVRVAPVPRIAIQYEVPDATFAEGAETVNHLLEESPVTVPCVNREPGCPPASV